MNKKRTIDFLIEILIFLQFFIFVFSIILSKEVSNLDEIWNYNTARQIMLGNLPYKNLSMITTPLLPFIVSILLKLFGDELLVFRVISAIILTILFFIMYRITFKITKNKVYSIISTSLIMLIFKNNFALDYNIFAVLINSLILYIELKFKNTESKRKIFNYNFYIGILAGLAFLTKQTTGCLIILEVCLIQFICAENDKELKANLKKYLKNLLIRIFGIVIPIFIFALYLIISNSLTDFINYAVLGLKTFSNKISYNSLLKNNQKIIKVLSIILPIFFIEELIRRIVVLLISNKKTRKNNKQRENLITNKNINDNFSTSNANLNNSTNILNYKNDLDYIFYYTTCMLINEYPITDENHFLIANLLLLMYGFIIIFNLKNVSILKKDNSKNISNENLNIQKENIKDGNNLKTQKTKVTALDTLSKLLFSINLAIVIFALDFISYYNFRVYRKYDVSKNINHYKKLYVSECLIERINAIDDVIKKYQNKTIYIVDAESAIYDIPLDRYYKNYDMFLNGNIGKDGADGIIEDIKNSKDSIYMIKKNGLSLNWQTPTKALDYIKKNLKYIGSTNIFDIYEKE